MKKIKNKHGFTLVELLVAISVLGIIMILAIPQLSNIQSSNKKTKYIKYAESMLTSAKLYTDSYTEDMFGNNKSGCVDIPYNELKEKDLLKDIKIDQTTCNSDKSFVQILKTNDHYIYGVSISCKDNNNKIVYEKLIPQCGDNGPDTTGPTITITSNLNTNTWDHGVNKTATISLTDSYGMLENTKIRYYWTKNNVLVGEKKTHTYENKRFEGSSTEGKKLSHTIDIPQNKTGKYTLHVEPIDVRDANGNYQTHSVTKGEFYLDNTAPSTPDVSTYKWVNNEETSAPTSISGLDRYVADSWSNKHVYSTAANSTDEDAGGVYYQYTTAGTTTNETDATGSTRNIKAQGESTIKYRACDAIDNCSAYTSPIKVKVDKTPPTLNNPTNSSSSKWTNQNVVIRATASDSGGSGLAGTYYNYNNTTTTKGDDWDSGSTAASVTGTWTGETETQVYVFAEDHAGNTTKKSAGNVKIDKTNPTCGTISVDSGTAGWNGWYRSNVTFAKTNGSDSKSGHKSTSLSKTGITYNTSGETVYLTTYDNAGNSCVTSLTVKIDKTAPTISCSGYMTSERKFTVSCSYSGASYSAFTHCYDPKDSSRTGNFWCHNKSLATRWAATPWSGLQYTFNGAIALTADSKYDIPMMVQAADEAGNTSNVLNGNCNINGCTFS